MRSGPRGVGPRLEAGGPARGEALWFRLLPFLPVLRGKTPGSVAGNPHGDLAGRPDSGEMTVEVEGTKQWRSLARGPSRSLAPSSGFPHSGSSSGLLSEAVHSALSCLAGLTALTLRVHLSLLMGGGEPQSESPVGVWV